MSNDLVLRWGIVSAGKISQDFCEVLKSLSPSKHVVQAVAARSLDDARNFAERFNISTYYDSYDKLFEDANVNIVYIGSLHTSHTEHSLKALNAGKHVLCEKPMAVSIVEQEKVFAASRKNNRFFMEGLWTRFFPVIDRLREELANNSVGEVRFFNGGFYANIRDVERLCKKDQAGGGILDLGVYTIQMACLVFNHEKPIKITATGHLMPTGVDETCNITLLYPNQRIASINVSTNCGIYAPTDVIGETGTISIPNFSWSPTKLTLPNGELLEMPLPEINAKFNYLNCSGFTYEAEAVYDAISKGLIEHPYVTHDNSRLIMSIMAESMKQLGYVLEE